MRIVKIAGLMVFIPVYLGFAQEEPFANEVNESLSVLDQPIDDFQESITFEQEPTVKNENISAVEDTITSESFVIPEPTANDVIADSQTFEEEEPVGIDTVSLEDSQGNWLFKRIWWERAEDRYGKIRELVNTIWESRTKFFNQRNELDRNVLDPFYISIGMGQGELQVILSELNDFFTKEREKDGALDEKERALYDTLEQEQESLKQLKMDVESITNLDHAIDDALGTLMDQINKARQLEKQSWENFKEIAHVLSDIKAREIYYMMDGVGRNIKNISVYVERDFSNHFQRLVAEAKKHVTRVLNQIKSLKEKGVDFKRQVDRMVQQEEQDKLTKDQQLEEEEAVVKPKVKEQSWLDWFVAFPGMIWSNIVVLIKIPYEMIFGDKK